MVIWKFQLRITDNQDLLLPVGAEILSVANQDGTLCLWALCDRAKNPEPERRRIEIIGTGNPMPLDVKRKFIGTVLIDPFVWHVFERV